MTNYNNTCFYIGVTNDISRRYFEHQRKLNPHSFSSRYNLQKLVLIAPFNTPIEAISYEKKIKGWTRARKIKLILENNPTMRNLAE